MSQSSIADQLRENGGMGIPHSKGTRIVDRGDEKTPLSQLAADIWFSRWCHNAFKNYPVVSKAKGARFLHNACKDLPAFVVGVGPSLDADIKDLKAVKRRGIIVSTDAALRALLANGITPDLVLSLDCKDDQNRLWRDLPPTLPPIPALINSCAHPSTIASWPGPVLFYNQYHQQDALCKTILPDVYPELGQIPSCATVGNMACLAANLMGCSVVCVVGFDFCYQPGQGDVVAYRYRAQDYKWVPKGMDFDDGWQPTVIKELYDNDERLARTKMVKSEFDKDFKSDPELEFYLDSFKYVMGHFKVPIVNCTPNGLIPQKAFVNEGDTEVCFPMMPLRQAIETHCKSEYQPGRHVLGYLDKILVDPRV